MTTSRFFLAIMVAVLFSPAALFAQVPPDAPGPSSPQDEFPTPPDQAEAKTPPGEADAKAPVNEDDRITPPPAPGAQEETSPSFKEEPMPWKDSKLSPKTGWIHEGMLGIYGGSSHAGPGGHYTLLYRPHMFYSLGVHAGLARTHYENEETLWKASLLHGQAAVEGRVYMIQDSLALWISANLGVGFLTETQSDRDDLTSDLGFLWGLGVGFDISLHEHISWGLAFRYYRQVARGETNEETRNYYGRGGINFHVSYRY